jgi:hypothetical protein
MWTYPIATIVAAGVLALALSGCERREIGAERGQVVADDDQGGSDASAEALQAQLDASFLGKFTPPDPEGFVEQGGALDRAGEAEVVIAFGRWTHGGATQSIMLVERVVGPDVQDEKGRTRTRAEIIQAFPMPTPREGEFLVTEGCTSQEFAEEAARIYANASTAGKRPGLTDPPSAAWRFDRQTGRLILIDAARVSCAFDHME